MYNKYTDYASIELFDTSGAVNYTDKLNAFTDAYTGDATSGVISSSGYTITDDLQDKSLRAALRLEGWNPIGDPQANAAEWYNVDFEYAQTPDLCSEVFAVVNYNTTFYGFSQENNFVADPRGFNAFIYGQASEFLKPNDTRLLLNNIVTNITSTEYGVTILNKDGTCISADYAITTFSLGVLQQNTITFSPPLPSWKNTAIQSFQMSIYTKIFFQFPPDKVFWDTNTTYFLYASLTRGYYPLWQSLDADGFYPGSGIFFVTVVTEQSYTVDLQDDDTTKSQILVTLRQMFGADKVPEPLDFMYPRWSQVPWAYGSYSNWPPGYTLEQHQNLRANVGRVWFAGEATSSEFFGFLHGAYFEGKAVGETIAGCLNGTAEGSECGEVNYPVLHGTSPPEEYSAKNGWSETSFQTVGDV